MKSLSNLCSCSDLCSHLPRLILWRNSGKKKIKMAMTSQKCKKYKLMSSWTRKHEVNFRSLDFCPKDIFFFQLTSAWWSFIKGLLKLECESKKPSFKNTSAGTPTKFQAFSDCSVSQWEIYCQYQDSNPRTSHSCLFSLTPILMLFLLNFWTIWDKTCNIQRKIVSGTWILKNVEDEASFDVVENES